MACLRHFLLLIVDVPAALCAAGNVSHRTRTSCFESIHIVFCSDDLERVACTSTSSRMGMDSFANVGFFIDLFGY